LPCRFRWVYVMDVYGRRVRNGIYVGVKRSGWKPNLLLNLYNKM